ncbi:hypothetical protein SAMN02910262_02486 [[Clostridium] aminophilum]|uniref:Uncharacterized protein n=1 Tax=[Clostridium] aminophilum TaxID=1526 RepID=A0A1I6KEN2_9FIRM|nr:hypothetical protein [[Clostridium] aminophilum]SFR89673.1 hypothetical protein SAMN02910262_02486 [[Clostridium] aminophilum]
MVNIRKAEASSANTFAFPRPPAMRLQRAPPPIETWVGSACAGIWPGSVGSDRLLEDAFCYSRYLHLKREMNMVNIRKAEASSANTFAFPRPPAMRLQRASPPIEAWVGSACAGIWPGSVGSDRLLEDAVCHSRYLHLKREMNMVNIRKTEASSANTFAYPRPPAMRLQRAPPPIETRVGSACAGIWPGSVGFDRLLEDAFCYSRYLHLKREMNMVNIRKAEASSANTFAFPRPPAMRLQRASPPIEAWVGSACAGIWPGSIGSDHLLEEAVCQSAISAS